MTEKRKYRIGLVQMRMGPYPEANLAAAVRAYSRSCGDGREDCLPAGAVSHAVLLPARGYSRSLILQSRFPVLNGKAGRSGERGCSVAIVASLFERRAPGLYHNTAVTLGADGKIASVYRKMHIPDDPLYFEKYYFAPGDLGFKAVDVERGRVGTLVCWDQWYPEGARLTAFRARRCCFIPRRLDGTRRRRRSLARRNTMHGKPSSGHTQLPTASMWRA